MPDQATMQNVLTVIQRLRAERRLGREYMGTLAPSASQAQFDAAERAFYEAAHATDQACAALRAEVARVESERPVVADRLAFAERERDEIVGLVQRRLQPAGSPPPGTVVALVEWITRDAVAYRERLERQRIEDADTIRELRAEVDALRADLEALDRDYQAAARLVGEYDAALSMCPDYCVSRKYLARHAPPLSPEPLTPEAPHGH